MSKNSNRKRSYKFLKEGIRLDGLKEYHKAIAASCSFVEARKYPYIRKFLFIND